jgi:hypothetical protein
MFIILVGVEAVLSRSSTSARVHGSASPSAFEGEGAHCLARGADFDNAGLVDGGRRQLQRVGLAGLAPGAPSCHKGGYRAVRTGGPPKTSRAARAAFVFWGGPAFAPVWRLRAEVDAPLVREDSSGDLPVG